MPEPPIDDVADAYARWYSLADLQVSPAPTLTVSELSARILSGTYQLTAGERRAIMASKALRESWVYLNRQRPGWLPPLAAAATSNVTERPFAGGTLMIVASAKPDRVYVTIRCTLEQFAPTFIEITGAAGNFVERRLPEPRAAGEFMFVLDLADADDAILADLLRDPRSMGQLVVS